MFEVGLVLSFEAAHRLVGDFGPAQRLHGHTYRVEVVVRGESIRPDGVLIDVGALQEAANAAIQPLNMCCLDELAELQGRNTTVEVLASYLHGRISAALGSYPDTALIIRVWESPSVWGAYEGPAVPDRSA